MSIPLEAPFYPMERASGCPLDLPPQLREIARTAPVSRVRIWDGSTPWLITGYTEARELLADPRVSSDQRMPGYTFAAPQAKAFHTRNRSMPTVDDPEHAYLRRMVTADFANRRMEALRPAFQRTVDELIDGLLAARNTADLFSELAVPMSSKAICEILGVHSSEGERFFALGKIMAVPGSPDEVHARVVRDMRALLSSLVQQAHAAPGDGVIGHLVRAGELPDEEIVATALLLMAAGHGATAHMITLGTMALLAHPDQLALVRESRDPAFIADALEELLRYLSVAHLGRRRVAKADIEVGDVLIREGEGIIIATDTANHDPRAFDGDPGTLDLRRDARHHLAFGFGVHQCIGQQLSRVLLQVVYGTLYRRIPTLALAIPVEQISYKLDLAIYGVNALPVTW
ncbi:cytochrome P450 [Nocardia sp. NEAU-G5]|uniref:Cytochrome P450 n=1 Tax=Nocardia albiluteola TaxID=2842303 RepID=A0ABS6BF96_9NOCA|nr:cytochrome P450 [Nocardia albiluteola]MBU3068110.1 cytochrome P450 [Nocardia albiluteola]